jgi:Zinc knuckle
MITLTVRLDDSFARLNDLKKTNPIKYPNKKKNPDAINWQYSVIFKKSKKNQKKDKRSKDKKKGKCYNCGKEGHFATNYYLKKNSTTTPKPKEEAKKPKPKDKEKEKATTNVMART